MVKKVDIAIIGAGTAGLSAYKEASKFTKSIVLIDKGPLGSTCARVGCMPSKQLIHIANQYYARQHFASLGINGAEHLCIDIPKVLAKVRRARDTFTEGVIHSTRALGAQFIESEATFINSNTLQVGEQRITAENIIIATGSSSVIAKDWQVDTRNILTSETIFEQTDLAPQMSIVGGGIIGLELGQALSRLGIAISLYHSGQLIGGLSDPKVNAIAIQIMQTEFQLYLNERVMVHESKNNDFKLKTSAGEQKTPSIFAAIGRKPNLANLGLENLAVALDDASVPLYDNTTMRLHHQPIYLTGDSNSGRPLLHEAADEGRMAGFNAANRASSDQCFVRRTPLSIVFTQPNIIIVGQSYATLQHDICVIGEACFDDQGRAKIENHNRGMLRIYGVKKTGKLLGAEGIVPAGEHLAHQLAFAIQQGLTASECLQMPFYHPVIEEGLRSALRDMVGQVDNKAKPFALALCDSEAIDSLR